MLFMLGMCPPGGPGGGPPRENREKLVAQTQKHYSQDMLYVVNFIGEEYKLFMAISRIAPLEFRGGGERGSKGKSTFSPSSSEPVGGFQPNLVGIILWG